MELGESELRGCLEERLGEFNSLYGEITRQVGGASYLIAKPAQPQEPDESGDPPKCNSVFRKVGVVARN